MSLQHRYELYSSAQSVSILNEALTSVVVEMDKRPSSFKNKGCLSANPNFIKVLTCVLVLSWLQLYVLKDLDEDVSEYMDKHLVLSQSEWRGELLLAHSLSSDGLQKCGGKLKSDGWNC